MAIPVSNKSRLPVDSHYGIPETIRSLRAKKNSALNKLYNEFRAKVGLKGHFFENRALDLFGKQLDSNNELKVSYSDKTKRKHIINLGLGCKFTYEGYCFSNALSEAIQTIGKLTFSNLPLIIEGATGTGKEVMAKSIHVSSKLKGGLVPVDCPSITNNLAESELFGHVRGSFTGADRNREGYIAQAENGTLFLDEIQQLSPEIQAKLLRYLQEGEYKPLGSDRIIKSNARIIAASNKSLKELVDKGEFREDLYMRLRTGYVCLPPLRDQPEAIIPLFNVFVNSAPNYAVVMNSDDKDTGALKNHIIFYENGVEDKLRQYNWPGNNRELKACAENAFVLSRWTEGLITNKMIQEFQIKTVNDSAPMIKLKEVEIKYIEKAINQSGGNIKKAAKLLDIPNSTLRDKIKRYGIRI